MSPAENKLIAAIREYAKQQGRELERPVVRFTLQLWDGEGALVDILDLSPLTSAATPAAEALRV